MPEKPVTDHVDMPGDTFGDNLKAARLKRGLSHEDLSGMAGIDAATVYRLEAGDRQPRLPTILRLANALGMSGSDLIRRL
jgi:XRE family transcriptional regulator, regulator of sulfur utilization